LKKLDGDSPWPCRHVPVLQVTFSFSVGGVDFTRFGVGGGSGIPDACRSGWQMPKFRLRFVPAAGRRTLPLGGGLPW